MKKQTIKIFIISKFWRCVQHRVSSERNLAFFCENELCKKMCKRCENHSFNRIHSLKYLKSTTLESKDIGFRKAEFVTKTQFLFAFFPPLIFALFMQNFRVSYFGPPPYTNALVRPCRGWWTIAGPRVVSPLHDTGK